MTRRQCTVEQSLCNIVQQFAKWKLIWYFIWVKKRQRRVFIPNLAGQHEDFWTSRDTLTVKFTKYSIMKRRNDEVVEKTVGKNDTPTPEFYATFFILFIRCNFKCRDTVMMLFVKTPPFDSDFCEHDHVCSKQLSAYVLHISASILSYLLLLLYLLIYVCGTRLCTRVFVASVLMPSHRPSQWSNIFGVGVRAV